MEKSISGYSLALKKSLTAMDLSNRDFSWTYLSGADMRGSKLRNSNFFMADLTMADLRDADTQNAFGIENAIFYRTKVTASQASELSGRISSAHASAFKEVKRDRRFASKREAISEIGLKHLMHYERTISDILILEMDLRRYDFSNKTFVNSAIIGSNVQGSSFAFSDLSGLEIHRTSGLGHSFFLQTSVTKSQMASLRRELRLALRLSFEVDATNSGSIIKG